MLVPQLVLLLAAVGGTAALLRPINLTLCEKTSENVSRFLTDLYVVQPQQHDSCELANTSTPVLFRVNTSAVDTDLSTPVVFVARAERYVQTWRIPHELPQISQLFYSVERILCTVPPLPLSQWGDEGEEIIIDVFTSSTGEESYTMEVTPVEDTVMKLDTEVGVNVSANSPEVRYFEFPPSASSVVVKATSNDFTISDGCIIVSIREAACPIDFVHQNALSSGMYQTMLTQSVIPVTANTNGIGRSFFLVLILTSSTFCDPAAVNSSDDSNVYDTIHTVNVTVSRRQEVEEFVWPIVLPVVLFVLGAVVSIVIFIIQECVYYQYVYRSSDSTYLCKECLLSGCNVFDVFFKLLMRVTEHICGYQHGTKPSCCIADAESQQQSETDHDDATPILQLHHDKDLTVDHLMQGPKAGEHLNIHYHLYFWFAFISGIFYGLPAIQFVVGQQQTFHDSGNEDICYYNFECAHRFGILTAFNNIWSNIGYVIMGLAFISIVAIRRAMHKKCTSKDKDDSTGQDHWSRGVPQFYGLYFAMGFALIMEGFMSAIYHICPSGLNFQFDTAFMFIIGGLLTVKVLQSRHPDINAYAFLAFFCFAIVIFLTMIGIYFSRLNPESTRVVLFLVLITAAVIFFTSFYNHHQLTKLWTNFKDELKHFCACFSNKEDRSADVYKHVDNKTDRVEASSASDSVPESTCRQKCCKLLHTWYYCLCLKHPIRLFRFIFVVIADIFVGIIMVANASDVPTIVLALFIVTALSILAYYLFWKICIYREPITILNYFVAILMVPCVIAALYFFTRGITNWKLTPSESRALNRPCLVMSFYDSHDVWHFLSAGALFLAFMFMLTLDDGIRDRSTKEIHVF